MESLPVVEAKVDEDDPHQIVVPVYIPEIPAHPLHRWIDEASIRDEDEKNAY